MVDLLEILAMILFLIFALLPWIVVFLLTLSDRPYNPEHDEFVVVDILPEQRRPDQSEQEEESRIDQDYHIEWQQQGGRD
jgi:hypothetical protein